MKRAATATWAAALSLVVLFSAFTAAEEQRRVTLAVLPCSDEISTITKFSPLVKYLAAETGFEFKMSVSTSAAEFDNSVKSGEFDFVLQDPNTYVSHARFFQPDSLLSALNANGEALQQGIVIARKGRGIGRIEDLRGKSVMFGNELSAAKWVAARDLFEEHGIHIEKDLRSHPVGGCCEDIAFNVYLGAVDAGVVCAHFLSEHSEKQKELGVKVDALVTVGTTRPVPERVFAAHRKTERAVVEKVVQALLKLDRRSPEFEVILSRAELGGFRRATDREYDIMRVRPGAKPKSPVDKLAPR
jgi:phosphonate transport system substrate-binding protein